MIRVGELIEKLKEFDPYSIVSIQDNSCHEDYIGQTVLLDVVESHRVCDMPAVLLSGDQED